jgi:predicted transcriptional regulator
MPRKKKAAKIGRPTLYKEEYCEMLIKHMAQGLSFTAFAGVVGVTRSTLYEWQKNPAFSDACKKGEMVSQLFFEKIGIRALHEEPKEFNTGLWIFFMKARFKWNDRPAIEALTEQIKAVTIDLPNAKKQQIITIDNEGDSG